MSEETISISFVIKLLKNKLKNKPIEKEELKLVDDYITRQQNWIKEKEKTDSIFKEKEVKLANKQLKEIQIYKFFLDKPSLEQYNLPERIHPAGNLKTGFVIEPIERNSWVWNWCGMKGISQVQIYPDSKKEYIVIEDKEILLDQKPITEFAFKLPDISKARKWIRNDLDSPELDEIWSDLQHYFRLFGDLNMECFYDVLCLFTLQNWMSEALESVFYLMIFGGWGGGKTTLAEMVTEVSRHGHQGDPTPAFIARVLDRQKITLFIDELDSISNTQEDNELLSIIRKGYRKGAQFSRINKETMDPEFFNVFGPKVITIHSLAEEALQQRGIPVMTTETTDRATPIINQIRRKYSKNIFDKLFFWYMERIIMVDQVDRVDQNLQTASNKITREELYNNLTLSLRNGQPGLLEQLEQLKGRNLELAFGLISILSLVLKKQKDNPNNLGNQKYQIDLIKSLKDIFESKKQIEEERLEIGVIGAVRDILYALWHKKKDDPNYITEEGYLKISHKELYSAINDELKKNKGVGIAPATFTKCTRELGFEAPLNKKKMKTLNEKGESTVRLCLIYDRTVLRKIGLPIEKLDHIDVTEEKV